MPRPFDQLRDFLDAVPGTRVPVLSEREERLLRSLRTWGERVTKGRLLTRYVFEARVRPDGTALVMEMEGRHSMSVGKQIAKRFEMGEDVGSVAVTRTRAGAIVEIRAQS